MFSVGVVLSTSIPFLTNNKYIVLPFYITLLLCLTGIVLLFSVIRIQKRNGYGRCSKKQNEDYLDAVGIDKKAPRG
jgi:hypothetical protein